MDSADTHQGKGESLKENLMPFSQANCFLLDLKISTPDLYLTSFSRVYCRQTDQHINSSKVLIASFSFYES